MYGELTKTQQKQVDYLERMNDKEIQHGCWSTSYYVTCMDCNEVHTFGAAQNAITFIERDHAGHRTRNHLLR